MLMFYGGGFLVILLGMLIFLVKTDVVNKAKLFIGSSKGAKLFRLYKKDGTEEEFVEQAKPGGVIKHDGDLYAILKGTINTSRSKNAPAVTLVEGNLNSVDLFGLVDDRVDTKQLRALFFAEREKAKSDLNPDVKLLKMICIGAVVLCLLGVVIAFFNWDTAQKTLVALQPIASYYNAIHPAVNATVTL